MNRETQQPAAPRPPEPIEIESLAREIAEAVDIDYSYIMRKTGWHVKKEKIAGALSDEIFRCLSGMSPHRNWIAQIDRIARNAEDIKELRYSISAFLRQAGIERIEEFSGNEAHFVASGKGDAVKTVQPAYIDKATGRTILAGRARRQQAPQDPSLEAPATGIKEEQ